MLQELLSKAKSEAEHSTGEVQSIIRDDTRRSGQAGDSIINGSVPNGNGILSVGPTGNIRNLLGGGGGLGQNLNSLITGGVSSKKSVNNNGGSFGLGAFGQGVGGGGRSNIVPPRGEKGRFTKQEGKPATVKAKPQRSRTEAGIAQVVQIKGVDELPSAQSKNRRFRIQFVYADKNGVRHQASVRFGNRKQEEFVDTRHPSTQIKRLSRLIDHPKTKNPLTPHHWNVWLLNSFNSIPEAVAAYRTEHNIL